MLAEDYAKEFNRLGLKRSIGFLPVSVFKLSERGGQLVNVEPILAGKYVKHNDNDGHVDTDDMVPQAFSHFSWEKSKRKLLICDIQVRAGPRCSFTSHFGCFQSCCVSSGLAVLCILFLGLHVVPGLAPAVVLETALLAHAPRLCLMPRTAC
eukprot:2440406-Rhodomonas_salina.2